METPVARYYTVLSGEIWGPVRCESLDGGGGELYLPDNGASTKFFTFRPFVQDGKMWGVSPIQKKSTKGWMKTDPDCFYWWHTFRFQKQIADGLWVPGTERVLFFRKPLSWRWQNDTTQPWIWTKGYLGLHYD